MHLGASRYGARVTITTSVELEGERPVVRHRSDAAGVAEAQARAARLAAAAGPGVVEVLRSGPVGQSWEVVTAFAGPPVTAVACGPPERLAHLGADVAAVLARLHEHGLVHGRLTPTRVLAGTGAGPVLCGFGPSADGAQPADDVAALGTVLVGLAGELPEGGARAALVALAGRARAEDPTSRPSARSLAHDLRALARSGTLGRPRREGRRGLVLAGAAAAVVAALAVVRAAGPDDAAGPSRASASHPSDPPTTTVPPVPACVAGPGRPLSAGECGRRVEVDGPVVVIDGLRSVVGRAGDHVLVGDWDCAGQLRPAVLRPSTGEVLVLSPPAPDGVRSAEVAERVRGATRLAVDADADGCPTLYAVRSDGERLPVGSGSAPPGHE